jgi:hypothetical protein
MSLLRDPVETLSGMNGANGRKHECRSCHSTAVERDWRMTRFERLVLGFVGRRIYICRDCQRRFYDKPIYSVDWYPDR